MKINYLKIITLFALLAISGVAISELGIKYINYIIYLSPALLFIKLYKNKYIFSLNEVCYPFLLLLLYVGILLIFQPSLMGLYHWYFVLASVVAFIPIGKEKININLNLLNYILWVLFIVAYVKQISVDFSLEALVKSQTSEAEGNVFPFIFGLLFIHSLSHKKYFLATINFLFVVLSFKRIVVLAVVSVLIYNLFFNRFISKKLLAFITIGISVGFIIFSYLLGEGYFDDYILRSFGIPAGHLTSGRSTFYGVLFSEDYSWFHFLFGKGFGWASHLSKELTGHLLHSDILKLFFETGIIITISFVYLLFKYSRNINLSIVLFIYFFTDNTLVYAFVIFFYLFLQNTFEPVKLTEKKLYWVKPAYE